MVCKLMEQCGLCHGVTTFASSQLKQIWYMVCLALTCSMFQPCANPEKERRAVLSGQESDHQLSDVHVLQDAIKAARPKDGPKREPFNTRW